MYAAWVTVLLHQKLMISSSYRGAICRIVEAPQRNTLVMLWAGYLCSKESILSFLVSWFPHLMQPDRSSCGLSRLPCFLCYSLRLVNGTWLNAMTGPVVAHFIKLSTWVWILLKQKMNVKSFFFSSKKNVYMMPKAKPIPLTSGRLWNLMRSQCTHTRSVP